MSIGYLFRLSFCILLLLPATVVASTPPVPAHPPGHIVDLASVLDTQQHKLLSDLLLDLEQKTTAQMVILTVNSLDGQDIDTFSLQTAEQWQIGQKGKDNGLLVVIAMEDRKYRFEVGYGLESVLPDSLVGTIGREALVPFFKQGKYGAGITAVTREILMVLSLHYGVTLSGTDKLPKPLSKRSQDSASWLILILFVLIFILFVYSRKVNRKIGGKKGYHKGTGAGPIIFPGGGWGSGSSGGFGGFSGGGGGFGGGGASGSW